MNTYDSGTLSRPVDKVAITNAFLRSIYNWMILGLGITAAISYLLTYTAFNSFLFTQAGFYTCIACIVAELILVFTLSLRIQKLSATTATAMFLAYSALNGISLSFIIIMYQSASVVQAFLTAAGMFGAMSIYGLTTKRDLSSIGSFCMMGVFGLIIAMVLNMFFQSNMMSMLISGVAVLLFLGITAYDTQLFKQMGESIPQDDAVAVRRGTIIGALNLYLDFINLFIHLLRLIGDRR